MHYVLLILAPQPQYIPGEGDIQRENKTEREKYHARLDQKLWVTLRTCVSQVLFLSIILLVAHANRDEKGYPQNEGLSQLIPLKGMNLKVNMNKTTPFIWTDLSH